MKRTSKTPLGVVLYEGPSLIDGKPIVALAAFGSGNDKTGDLPTTWVMRSDIEPHVALKRGCDASVCGSCPFRNDGVNPETGGCYVVVANGPLQVYRAWKRGRYNGTMAMLKRAMLAAGLFRMTAYGEGPAVPFGAFRVPMSVLKSGDERSAGYTHRWRDCPQEWRAFLMASVHSPEERREAKRLGWRTFRATPPGGQPLPGERWCPAETKGLQCVQCRACCGTGAGPKWDVLITAHGFKTRAATSQLG